MTVTPKEHALVSDAILKSVMQLFRGTVTEVSFISPVNSFLGESDMTVEINIAEISS